MTTGPEQPETALGAMEAVLNTTELLETILENLPIRHLLQANLISHQWRSTVAALIRSNPSVRKRLFLQPATLQEMLDLHPLEHHPADSPPDPCTWHFANATWDLVFHLRPPEPRGSRRSSTLATLAVVNAYLFAPPRPPESGIYPRTAYLPLRPDMMALLATAGAQDHLPRHMFVTQPLLAAHAWCLPASGRAGESTTTTTVTAGEERSSLWAGPGNSYLRFMDGYDAEACCSRGIGRLMEGLERGWVASGLGREVEWTGAKLVLGECVTREEILERVRGEGGLGLERLTIG
ncbi:hypothetical protein LTR75_012318 [Friedmanniomyces endolithicus]|nr:hypothetical protein LTR75_012318 [Friedmanniomyces endolithicus]